MKVKKDQVYGISSLILKVCCVVLSQLMPSRSMTTR